MPASDRAAWAAAWRGTLGCPECCRGALWWLPIQGDLQCDTWGVTVEPAALDDADA